MVVGLRWVLGSNGREEPPGQYLPSKFLATVLLQRRGSTLPGH